MTPELEKYYENYFDLFMSPGWRQFKEEALDGYEALDVEKCKDWDSFLVTKTRREQLNNILKFEDLIRTAYENSMAAKDFEYEEDL